MAKGAAVYATLIAGFVVGLILIVYGEATGGNLLFVGAGGALGLLSMALLSLIVARLPEPEHEHEHEHEHGEGGA